MRMTLFAFPVKKSYFNYLSKGDAIRSIIASQTAAMPTKIPNSKISLKTNSKISIIKTSLCRSAAKRKRPFAAIRKNRVAKGLDIRFIEPNRCDVSTIVLTTSTNPHRTGYLLPLNKLSNQE